MVLELVSCLPAAQVMQELCPELDWYLPAAQVLHELEPEVEYCPDAHDVHELRVWLEEDWYLPAAHERQLPPDRYCPRVQVGGGGGARLELERRREDEDPAQPVQLHVLVLLPLIQLLLTLWPLHDEGHRPFEQQPFEPRSAVVEHVPELDEEEWLDELAHDHLADQPEWVALPSVVNRTRM